MKNSFLLLIQLTLLALILTSSVTVHDLSDDSIRNKIFKEFENMQENYNADNLPLSEKPENSLKFLGVDIPNYCDIRDNAKSADYYYLLPVLKAKINSQNDLYSFNSSCFKENRITIEKLTKEDTIINFESSNSKNFFCKDSYIISISNFHNIHTNFMHGAHKIHLKNLTDEDLLDIKVNGIRIFAFCDGFLSTIHSLLMTLKLFIGGMGNDPSSRLPILKPEVPEYMEKANIDFLERFVGFKMEKRREQYGNIVLDFDEKEIKTGDFIFIFRLDGLDPMIMLGTGSTAGHSAVAAWIDGELHIIESQDGWYWPKRGIQRNKWSIWKQWAHNADFHVAILPLKEEYRKKLDTEKAIKWFEEKAEGLNYGYHNFLFSWVDTPDKNMPNILQLETAIMVFSLLEKISRSTVDLIIGEALNQRVGTKDKKIHEVAYEAAKRNQTLEELMAMPEIEGWDYSDGHNYVCSCFVIAFYKNGGMFDDMEINSTEFTPKDVYQLNIFDRSYKNNRPSICQEADPDLEFCQVMGKYKIQIPGYSTIKPYSRMNERCPSQAPDFIRPDGC
jgi:hypothetical protein